MVKFHESSYKTVYHHFNKWSKARVFEHVFYEKAKHEKETSFLIADTSFVKNVFGKEVLGRNPTDRGRKATKVSLLTNNKGTPLCSVFHRANKNDGQTLQYLLSTAKRKLGTLEHYGSLFADKGYDSETCRKICTAYSLKNRIPYRRQKDIGKER